MRTVTGEPLKLGRKLCSTMSSGDIGVKFHYRESEDVKFPVISMSEASDKGTWLVIIQCKHRKSSAHLPA